jgi:hypothetical protein
MNRDDFHALYERYGGDVFRFALYLSGHWGQAEDVASETFMRAWTAADGIQTETVKAYLLSIARNLVRAGFRRPSPPAEMPDDLPDPQPGPEAQAEVRLELRAGAPHGLARVGQIAVPVLDVERAIGFYRDVLGMRFLFKAPPGLGFFDCSGVRLMLDEPHQLARMLDDGNLLALMSEVRG